METLKFEKVYVDYNKKVYNTIKLKLNGDKETAEDLTVNVFVKISKHLGNFNSEISCFDTWVYNITKNVIIDYFRSKEYKTKKRQINFETYVDSEGNDLYPVIDSVNTDSNMLTNEIDSIIQNTLNSMKEINQKVCRLDIEGLKMSEIATKLNIPEGTVKVYVMRFKNKLKSKLEKQYS